MATTPQPTVAEDAQQEKRDFRQEVTDNIGKLLESNLAPWQKPWDPTSPRGSMPLNPTTGKRIAVAMPRQRPRLCCRQIHLCACMPGRLRSGIR